MTDCQHWMTMAFEQSPTQPPVGVWIPYYGEGCPVSGRTLVQVRRSDGLEMNARAASDYDWEIIEDEDDITHYMIVEE